VVFLLMRMSKAAHTLHLLLSWGFWSTIIGCAVGCVRVRVVCACLPCLLASSRVCRRRVVAAAVMVVLLVSIPCRWHSASLQVCCFPKLVAGALDCMGCRILFSTQGRFL
jgi:hypothetical protein